MNTKIILLAILLLLSVGLNIFVLHPFVKKEVKVTEKPQDNFPFLARRIFFDDPNDVIINFIDLRKQLKEYTANLDGDVGLYFEYLPTGNHIGLNDRETFRRASLVKIPMVMQVYRGIEEGKISKQEELILTKELIDSGYGDFWKQGVGAKITVEKAIQLVLVESDNTAYNLLRKKVDSVNSFADGSQNAINFVYDYLDVEREDGGITLNISARGFASILKNLYFSGYLSFKSSNEILEIMSESITPYKLLSVGLPAEIPLSHKYGVNRDGTNNNLVTSDCGIVYYPKRQYILCVMLNLPPEKAAPIISDLSKKVYDYISNVNN